MPILFAGAGFCWTLLVAHLLLAQELTPALEGQDLVVQGVVSDLPTVSPSKTRLEFIINGLWKIDNNQKLSTSVEIHNKPIVERLDDHPGKILLNWYNPPAAIQVGQVLTLNIRLKRPHGFSNPGGFDYEAWLFRRGIRATGYVKNLNPEQLAALKSRLPANLATLNSVEGRQSSRYWLHAARQRLQRKIQHALQDSPFKGIILALTIGEREAITAKQWEVFTDTGTNHLIAISGLHIGLIAGLAFYVGRWLWSRWAYAVLRVPAQKVAAIWAMGFAAAYAAMAGFSIPTQRALIMVLIVMLGVFRQRHVQPKQVLSLALLVVLIIDPMAILDSGFWLSFAAVGILLYGMTGRLAPKGFWWQWGRAQWLVFLGLAPLLLWFFQNVALVAPFANVVAIPWVSFLTVPFSLLGAVLLSVIPAAGELCLWLADLSLRGLWPVLDYLATLTPIQWGMLQPPLWTLIPATIGVFWYLSPSGMPARWVGAIWLLPLFFIKNTAMEDGEAEFTLLDVGQGLAAVIKTQRHVLVYDSGPRFSSTFDTGRAVLVPYLRHAGIRKVDRFVVSHGDNDHIGGAQSLIAAMPVSEVDTSVVRKFTQDLAQKCTSGTQWEWDGVKFRYLSPDVEDYAVEGSGKNVKDRKIKENNLSCVLMVQTPTSKVLLTGDIEKSVEQELVLEATQNSINADVLVMPHHGSKTSSSKVFIDRVAPQFALAAVGYKNRFGFPDHQVVERYLQKNVTVLDTAQCGAISFILHRDRGVELTKTYRQSARRYWHSDVSNSDVSRWYSF